MRKRRIVVAYRSIKFGSQILLLNSLLGNLDPHSSDRFRNGAHRGFAPQNPKQRARLLDLAARGNEIAWEFLRLVGKDHLYSNASLETDSYSILNPKHLKKYKHRR